MKARKLPTKGELYPFEEVSVPAAACVPCSFAEPPKPGERTAIFVELENGKIYCVFAMGGGHFTCAEVTREEVDAVLREQEKRFS